MSSDITASLQSSEIIKGAITPIESIKGKVKMSESITGKVQMATSVKSHPDLDGRDLPDQHPIESITGLQDTLDGKIEKVEAMTNMDIEKILGGLNNA